MNRLPFARYLQVKAVTFNKKSKVTAFTRIERLLFFFLLQRKFPTAATGLVGNFRIAADALAGEAAVNGAGKLAILHHAHRLAGMELHALPLPRRLHAAVHHAVDQRVAVDADLVVVDVGVKPQGQRLRQPLDACLFRQPQKLFQLQRFHHGKLFPNLHVVEHGFVHAQPALQRLEPDAVRRQPVFGINLQQLNQLLPG